MRRCSPQSRSVCGGGEEQLEPSTEDEAAQHRPECWLGGLRRQGLSLDVDTHSVRAGPKWFPPVVGWSDTVRYLSQPLSHCRTHPAHPPLPCLQLPESQQKGATLHQSWDFSHLTPSLWAFFQFATKAPESAKKKATSVWRRVNSAQKVGGWIYGFLIKWKPLFAEQNPAVCTDCLRTL